MIPRAYRIKALLKNNRLLAAIEREFPGLTLKAVARACRISPTGLSALVAMRRWPGCQWTLKGRDSCGNGCIDGWSPTAWKLATILRDAPAYLFDRDLYGIAPTPIVLAIDRPALEATGMLALPASPEELANVVERSEAVHAALGTLTPKEAMVLRRRFGLDDGREHSLDDVGITMAVTRERVRQIEARALRKLRHPTRSKKLRDYV